MEQQKLQQLFPDADLNVFSTGKKVLQVKRNTYREMRYFSRYHHDCLTL